MNVYLVRLAVSGEVVGVFSANDVAALWQMLDEHLDPGGCEYLAMPSGGLIVLQKTTAKLPARMVDPGGEEERPVEQDQHPLKQGVMLETWAMATRGQKWAPLSGNAIDAALRGKFARSPR